MISMNQIVGKIYRKDAEVIIFFRVKNKYYPATEYNSQLFESYLHTGDPKYLKDLKDEIQY